MKKQNRVVYPDWMIREGKPKRAWLDALCDSIAAVVMIVVLYFAWLAAALYGGTI